MKANDPYVAELLERDKNFPVLPAMKRPCGDCAVEGGLYREYSDLLKGESREVQQFLCDRWWCHVTGRRCQGNVENVFGKEPSP